MRKKFNPAERATLAVGAAVEWLNASTWRTGVVVGAIVRDVDGWESLAVRDTGPVTRTMSPGRTVCPGPKSVRVAS